MKKFMTNFFLAILTVLLLSTPVMSATPLLVELLDAATSTGAGSPVAVRLGYGRWTCEIAITGSPTAVTVRVNGNLGGSKWSPDGMAEIVLNAAELSAEFATKAIINSSVLQMRGNVIVLTGGSDPTVSSNCLGVDR